LPIIRKIYIKFIVFLTVFLIYFEAEKKYIILKEELNYSVPLVRVNQENSLILLYESALKKLLFS